MRFGRKRSSCSTNRHRNFFPPYIPIDVSENETVMDPVNEDLEENEGLKNTNWSPPVCALFGEVMCCPAFSGRPDYLQYVLALAFYLRVGATNKFPKPELPGPRRQLIVDEFKRLSKRPVDEENLFQEIWKVFTYLLLTLKVLPITLVVCLI
jgi:hypothetical protein